LAAIGVVGSIAHHSYSAHVKHCFTSSYFIEDIVDDRKQKYCGKDLD